MSKESLETRSGSAAKASLREKPDETISSW